MGFEKPQEPDNKNEAAEEWEELKVGDYVEIKITPGVPEDTRRGILMKKHEKSPGIKKNWVDIKLLKGNDIILSGWNPKILGDDEVPKHEEDSLRVVRRDLGV